MRKHRDNRARSSGPRSESQRAAQDEIHTPRLRATTIEGAPRGGSAQPSEPSRACRALRVLARAAVRTFNSAIEATGLENVDTRKPTIYAPTHPNSIFDPLQLR